MPRLRNAATGVVVNVDDDTASRLDKNWKPFEHGASTPDGAPKGNASREEWADYAASKGVEVPEGAKQKEIRELVAAAEAATGDEGEGVDE